MNLEKAIEFVRNNGSEVEQARLNFILAGERPSQEVVARLFARQRPDGGWSPLEQNQQEDGRWQSEDGPGQDVHATLEAMRALRLCGRV